MVILKWKEILTKSKKTETISSLSGKSDAVTMPTYQKLNFLWKLELKSSLQIPQSPKTNVKNLLIKIIISSVLD